MVCGLMVPPDVVENIVAFSLRLNIISFMGMDLAERVHVPG